MYLPVPPQLSCPLAWLAAVKAVDGSPDHEAHNVIIDVANPGLDITRAHPIVKIVDDFMCARAKSVLTVANTIFPQSVYERYGAPELFRAFQERILPRVRKKGERWSGYYFERLINYPARNGEPINQLWNVVERIRSNNPANNKYEVVVFDPERDTDKSPYGGQCLSFMSFKLITGGPEKRLALTAMYRNHYYIEKLLGNLIGLGRLMEFVAKEAGVGLGPLTVHSTHAEIDQPKKPKATRGDLLALISQCEATMALKAVA
jgi:thymidylate synthase